MQLLCPGVSQGRATDGSHHSIAPRRDRRRADADRRCAPCARLHGSHRPLRPTERGDHAAQGRWFSCETPLAYPAARPSHVAQRQSAEPAAQTDSRRGVRAGDFEEDAMPLKFALYPGCAAKGATPELLQSTMAIIGRLGIEVTELTASSCCGAGVVT